MPRTLYSGQVGVGLPGGGTGKQVSNNLNSEHGGGGEPGGGVGRHAFRNSSSAQVGGGGGEARSGVGRQRPKTLNSLHEVGREPQGLTVSDGPPFGGVPKTGSDVVSRLVDVMDGPLGIVGSPMEMWVITTGENSVADSRGMMPPGLEVSNGPPFGGGVPKIGINVVSTLMDVMVGPFGIVGSPMEMWVMTTDENSVGETVGMMSPSGKLVGILVGSSWLKVIP